MPLTAASSSNLEKAKSDRINEARRCVHEARTRTLPASERRERRD